MTESVLMWIALGLYAAATAMYGVTVTFSRETLARRALLVSAIGLAAQAASLGFRDEALVFKVYDSEKDGRARFTPHTSFDDPATPSGAPPRQSIEARALAFF